MKKNKKKVKLFRIERMLIKFCLILLGPLSVKLI